MIVLPGAISQSAPVSVDRNYAPARNRISWGTGTGADRFFYPSIGQTNRSDASPNVQLYSVSDSGFTPPGGELFGVETEIGSTKAPPRTQGQRVIRHYVDAMQTNFQSRNYDRSELQFDAATFNESIGYQDEYWVGWSELYKTIDNSRITTVMQFRGQITPAMLNAQAGISVASGTDEYFQSTDGGPCIALNTAPVEGVAHHQIDIRGGNSQTWHSNVSHALASPIVLNQWYDVIFNIKQSSNNDGFLRAWIGLKNTLDIDNPTLDYSGITEYKMPVVNGVQIVPRPAWRWGLYRFGVKGDFVANGYPALTTGDRYMEKYSGNLKLLKHAGMSGFNRVKPRDF